MLTVSFKMLRLMSLNRRMSVLWQALAESAADVMAFMLSFFILLLGFGYMAYMMWGVNTGIHHNLHIHVHPTLLIMGSLRKSVRLSARYVLLVLIPFSLLCLW